MDLNELLDREGIRKTLADYTMSGDRLRVDDFIATFTEDAIFESEGVTKEKTFRYVGRDAIKAFISSWGRGARDAQPVHQAKFIRHHLSTCQIDLTGQDSARGRTYWVAYTNLGPDHCGYYLDEFRKVGGQWRIAHRKVREDWMTQDSLYATAVANLRGRDH
jgi:3-phenylpropionate/cinnamic acid dioxygenase small subunit